MKCSFLLRTVKVFLMFLFLKKIRVNHCFISLFGPSFIQLFNKLHLKRSLIYLRLQSSLKLKKGFVFFINKHLALINSDFFCHKYQLAYLNI